MCCHSPPQRKTAKSSYHSSMLHGFFGHQIQQRRVWRMQKSQSWLTEPWPSAYTWPCSPCSILSWYHCKTIHCRKYYRAVLRDVALLHFKGASYSCKTCIDRLGWAQSTFEKQEWLSAAYLSLGRYWERMLYPELHGQTSRFALAPDLLGVGWSSKAKN